MNEIRYCGRGDIRLCAECGEDFGLHVRRPGASVFDCRGDLPSGELVEPVKPPLYPVPEVLGYFSFALAIGVVVGFALSHC